MLGTLKISIHTCNPTAFFLFLKRTVGGVLGGNGANVLKHVALGHSIANGRVPGLLRDMVESTALDQTNRLENATQNRVLVSLALTFVSPCDLRKRLKK